MDSSLTYEENRVIQQQLTDLGFPDQNMTHYFKHRQLNDSGQFVSVSCTHPEDDICTDFRFDTNKQGVLELTAMTSGMNYESPASPYGVGFFKIEWTTTNGSWPSFEQITAELYGKAEQRIKMELVPTNPHLKAEFGSLGFDCFDEMFKNASYHANLTHLTTEEIMALPFGNEQDRIQFEFIIVSPKGDQPPHIAMARAQLVLSGDDQETIRKQTERTFYRISDQIPTKAHMIHQVLTGLELKPELFERAKEIIRKSREKGVHFRLLDDSKRRQHSKL